MKNCTRQNNLKNLETNWELLKLVVRAAIWAVWLYSLAQRGFFTSFFHLALHLFYVNAVENKHRFIVTEPAKDVTYNEGIQSGGSRDTYRGTVDKSQFKTTYGERAQVSGNFIQNIGGGKH